MTTLLNQAQIQAGLSASDVEVFVSDSVTSTNDSVRQHASDAQIVVSIAENQTLGRGRFEHQWYSPYGENLYLSVRREVNGSLERYTALPLVISLAICHVLERTATLDPALKIKWPNDVYWEKAKVAGSMVEVSYRQDKPAQLIMGVGMNINMHTLQNDDAHSALQTDWASLKTATGKTYDRNPIAMLMIDTLLTYLDQFETDGFVAFRHAWNKRCLLTDKQIDLMSSGQKVSGKVVGIDDIGRLKLKSSSGGVSRHLCGTSSIRDAALKGEKSEPWKK